MHVAKLVSAALLVATLACQGQGSPAASGAAPAADAAEKGPAPAPAMGASPLLPLLPVIRHLNTGIAAFLGGGELAAAFAPWSVDAPEAAALEALRGEIKAAAITQAVHVSMELELIFVEQGRDAYYLRTSIFGTDAGVGFVSFAGRTPDGGKVGVTSVPLADYGGEAQPFRAAAEALVAAVKGPECAKLPFADPADIERLVSAEGPRKELVTLIERSKQNLAEECARLAALRPDAVRMRLDDHAFVAATASNVARGTLKGDFRYEGGKLVYTLKGVRRFPE